MKSEETRQQMRYIFDLFKWQEIMQEERKLSKKNESIWCDVPEDLQFLSRTICQLYAIDDCTRLPCHLVYSTAETLENIKCRNPHGQIQSYYECKRGFSFDLFTKNFSRYSYPSLIADPFSPFRDNVYVNLLHNYYRSCSSIWGFFFKYESIIYYPWVGDENKLKLFDITYGYDRSIHDFIAPSHLFLYIDQLKFTSKRLTVNEVMNSKKPIYSTSTSDIYWPNLSKKFFIDNATNNSSYIKAPILWMNSNCRAKSGRTPYMNKLMKYIAVDNYGTCGKNIRQLPEHIVKIQGSSNRILKNIATYDWEAGKLALSKEYLFTIAIENSLTSDYISEKLWQPLTIGSVPIYLGAPNVYDWLPCRTNCIIDLRQFKSPEDAATFVKNVAKNKTLYESYHQWRKEPVAERFQHIIDYNSRISNSTLECALCEMSHRVGQGEDREEIKKDLRNRIGRF
ncbi:unnamed protein product [Adineta ricciae]|uniref:Fucosyltransferase n=1 Tax=Adineta ricciae TaxID=249248 RepID=A0A816AG45_ADIRI|nr:unnamed protein product [Adineta ricciae]CAF1597653.1 unnamed protein product [Adineta ricciae]